MPDVNGTPINLHTERKNIMKKITDIIGKYTTGEKTLEETNAA